MRGRITLGVGAPHPTPDLQISGAGDTPVRDRQAEMRDARLEVVQKAAMALGNSRSKRLMNSGGVPFLVEALDGGRFTG